MRLRVQREFSREQRTTVIYGVICFSLILLVLQLWLLTATMNAWLGGDASVVWPALGVSVALFLLNLGLLRSLL